MTGKRIHIDVVLSVEARAVNFINVCNTSERHVQTLNCKAARDLLGAEGIIQPNMEIFAISFHLPQSCLLICTIMFKYQ